MKHTFINKLSIYILITCFVFSSCKKFLEAKSDAKLSTPSTLSDMQAMLDNSLMNIASDFINTSSDEYYLDYPSWDGEQEKYKQSYIWDYTPETEDGQDWTTLYNSIFYANSILDNIIKISPQGQQDKWNAIKGSALFFRAFHFFQLSQIYSKQYDLNTASADLGVPLRLTSDFNVPTTRPSVKQVYDQIINDLQEAIILLPIDAGYKTRPSKPAAYGLLARVYLQIADYQKAFENAKACLSYNNTLMDFNNYPDAYWPFTKFTPETIFYSVAFNALNSFDWEAKADSVIYNSYSLDDLRKTLYFEDVGIGAPVFEGSYSDYVYELFNGIATDEIYLIRAECNARLGKIADALADLNTLLINRYKTGAFTSVTATDATDAIDKVLFERRKELLNRGVRWLDLRRLNKEPGRAITIKRSLGGQVYDLPPNDFRYTLLIPRKIIEIAQIPQNPR